MTRFLPSRTLLAAALTAFLCLIRPVISSAQVVVVQPYVQPGNGHALNGTDVKVIQWLTDQTSGDFTVEYFEKDGPVKLAKPVRFALDFKLPPADPKKKADKEPAKEKPAEPIDPDDLEPKEKKDPKEKIATAPEKDQQYFRYQANLNNLPFNSEITYRVKLGDKVVREASFRTRATDDRAIRCVLVGDLAQGRSAQKEVAYRISLEKPDFLMALGDIVYPTGRVNQYMAYYWDTYNNVARPGLKSGAPLMASVPFYPVLGNHDIGAKLTSKMQDALAIYHFFAPPRNGPGEGTWNTTLDVKDPITKIFRAATAHSYPFIDTYSFDNGPAHFVVINTNRPLDAPVFRKWLVDDLKSTKAKWKFVCFHIPGFQSSRAHYAEQQARTLEPIFEECGVDMTFAGHVHNYQRSVPLKFVPKAEDKGRVLGGKKFQVNGAFTLDTKFDGVKNTRPDGIIHVVAGGGGATLYGPEFEKTSAALKKEYGPDNYVDFTARMVVDKHSFVVLDLTPYRLELRTLGANGTELDRITITKDK